MSEAADNESFPALRDPSSGEEHEKEIYFAYGATLRIFGDIRDLDEITQSLGVVPTHAHRKGDRRESNSPSWEHDMWMYNAPTKETEPLHVHIDALWNTFKERKQYLLQLKHDLKVDVFLGYRSNCDTAGVEVPYQSLEIFRELQVPFGLSIIIA